MKYTNVFEKLFCLGNLIVNSWYSLIFVAIAVVLLVLQGIKKISKKKCFCLLFLSYLLLLVVTIYTNLEQLGVVADNLADHFFTSLYFPSVYVYLFVLIMANVVIFGSFMKRNVEKSYRTIHGICFIAMNFIFTLILEIVAKNKIDVFSKSSLFSNTNLVALLEMSVNIFILWIISLASISLTNFITTKIVTRKELQKKAVNFNGILTPDLMVDSNHLEEEYLAQEESTSSTLNATFNQPSPAMESQTTYQFLPQREFNRQNNELTSQVNNPQLRVEEAYLKTNNQIDALNSNSNYSYVNWKDINHSYNNQVSPYSSKEKESIMEDKNIELDNSFDLSSFIPKKQHTSIPSLNNDQIFEQILKNELPVIKNTNETSNIEQEKNTYTLNDYRIFNKMLKDIKEHNQSNTIHIDKNLEYRLITKYSTETYDMFKKMLKNYSN